MICCFWKQTTLELYELYQLGRLGWSQNLILSQLDSDWKIITFLIFPFPCTIVGLWVLGNCRGINCGQILSLNKTCSNSSGNPTHKSHSYPFPPTPAQTRPPIHGNFLRFGNRSVVRMNMSVTSHWWCAELQEGVSQGGSWGVKKETIILANDRSWWDVLATNSIHIVSLSFTGSLGMTIWSHLLFKRFEKI